MKTITIGDIHGRNVWKEIVSKENDADQFIFMGDYFDTHDEYCNANQQIQNFNDIIAFKKANMNKVVLLFGNHCFHYLRGVNEKYAGYQAIHSIDIGEVIHCAINENLIQMCFIYENLIFTHAGVTKTWCKNILGNDNISNSNAKHFEQMINDMFKYQPSVFNFTKGKNYDDYGDDICQTPIWVRPRSLRADKIDGFIQIVGHTVQDQIITEDTDVFFIDTLGTSGEYLVYEDGKMIARTL